ncbi:hypothetical protein PJE062_2707 [Pseudovibrio sp. JE062]|nr:hypothetical protein PJE062_2707 [Pseudovibrio sp. JE062]
MRAADNKETKQPVDLDGWQAAFIAPALVAAV